MVTALGKALWPESLQASCQDIEISNKCLNVLLILEYFLTESEAGKDVTLHVDSQLYLGGWLKS